MIRVLVGTLSLVVLLSACEGESVAEHAAVDGLEAEVDEWREQASQWERTAEQRWSRIEELSSEVRSLREQLSLYRRPLDVPVLEPGAACPVSEVGHEIPEAGQTYGEGPVYATLGTEDGTVRPEVERDGWLYPKVLWWIDERYDGPVLVRGRQLDGPSGIAFTHLGGSVDEPLDALNVSAEQRDHNYDMPGNIVVGDVGCYAFQVDGPSFTDVIVFQVVR